MPNFISINSRYSVDIDNARLNAGIMPKATDYGKRVQAAILREAIARAPMRSGELKASHHNVGILRRGPWAADGVVRNTSQHAAVVHEGYDGIIYPKRGRFLTIHGPAGEGVVGFAKSVRGQSAKPWLAEAAKAVAARMGGVVHTTVGH